MNIITQRKKKLWTPNRTIVLPGVRRASRSIHRRRRGRTGLQFDLSTPVQQLDANTVFRVANEARPAADYVWAQFLPEELSYNYTAKSANMIVRATMAGLVGTGSPYPTGGAPEITTFKEETAKLAIHVPLGENSLRQMQEVLLRMAATQTPTIEYIQNELLNFLDAVVVQGHLDAMEFMRGQALVTGKIDWTFGKIRLNVDYQIPAANMLPNRTGTAAWDSTASVFHTDMRELERLLGSNEIIYVAHGDTINAIRNNPANNLVTVQRVIAHDTGTIVVRKVNPNTNTFTHDAGDVHTFIQYSKEAEILAPNGVPVKVPFCDPGKIVALSRGQNVGYQVGMGAQQRPPVALGRTHLAPTTEGGLTPGRWSRLYTPEMEPWSVVGQCVTNGIPVIEEPRNVAVASSDLA